MSENEKPQGYDALLAGEAYVAIEPVTLLSVSGADRTLVLNNVCTADLKQLESGEFAGQDPGSQVCRGTEAFITDGRGKTLGHVMIYSVADAFLVLSIGDNQVIAGQIDKYVIREDVTITQCASKAALVHDFDAEKPPVDAAYSLRVPWTSESDLLVIGSGDEDVTELFGKSGLESTSAEAFEAARLEHGFPMFGVDLSEANLPQEIGRDARAISFTKGCYLGQETIARLDAMGQVQKKLVKLRIEGDQIPQVGEVLSGDDAEAGEIRSAAWSPAEDAILGLGFVRRKWFEPGTVLETNTNGVRVVVL